MLHIISAHSKWWRRSFASLTVMTIVRNQQKNESCLLNPRSYYKCYNYHNIKLNFHRFIFVPKDNKIEAFLLTIKCHRLVIAFVAKNFSISTASEFVLVKQHGAIVVICKYKSEIQCILLEYWSIFRARKFTFVKYHLVNLTMMWNSTNLLDEWNSVKY